MISLALALASLKIDSSTDAVGLVGFCVGIGRLANFSFLTLVGLFASVDGFFRSPLALKTLVRVSNNDLLILYLLITFNTND